MTRPHSPPQRCLASTVAKRKFKSQASGRQRSPTTDRRDVVEAVQRSNNNVGGNVVEQAGQWAVVRGVGLIESTADVENIVIGAQNGIPIYVRNIADVKLGSAFRTGVLDKKRQRSGWRSSNRALRRKHSRSDRRR